MTRAPFRIARPSASLSRGSSRRAPGSDHVVAKHSPSVPPRGRAADLGALGRVAGRGVHAALDERGRRGARRAREHARAVRARARDEAGHDLEPDARLELLGEEQRGREHDEPVARAHVDERLARGAHARGVEQPGERLELHLAVHEVRAVGAASPPDDAASIAASRRACHASGPRAPKTGARRSAHALSCAAERSGASGASGASARPHAARNHMANLSGELPGNGGSPIRPD